MRAITVLFCFSVMIPGILFSQEDIRLTRIKETIGEMQKSIDEPVEARKDRYIKDLAALEKTIGTSGNLDHVLQVKSEREAWEANKPTPSIDPRNNAIPLGLRKLRYYFDLETSKLSLARDSTRDGKTRKIVAELQNLEESLTKEGNINDALASRKVKEELAAGRLVGNNPADPDEDPEFEKWLETVRFVVPSGYAFRISKSSVYLTPPGGAEKLISEARVEEKSRTVEWELGNGAERSIEVSKDLKSAELTADTVETLTIETLPAA